MERQGRWMEASSMYARILRNAPKDAHTHLALARLEARRELKSKESVEKPSVLTSTLSRAEEAFVNGTKSCPKSVHIWQAWAVYEESRGNLGRARELFEVALELDSHNPYVCHAFGLMEKKSRNDSKAIQLFEKALSRTTTAALVCSLGELFLERNNTQAARDLYARSAQRLKKEKDRVEVYLAHAWLEEHYFGDHKRATELIHLALELDPASSLANVALARLEGRMQRHSDRGESPDDNAAAKRLAEICNSIEEGMYLPSDPTDGRIFNALARIEAKARNFRSARHVLERGMELYPQDHALFQAAGKVEERVGNFTAARRFYVESLQLEPSAPTLVAFAMLELRKPESGTVNVTRVKGLFEEALLLDPRHGPAYNAYGNAEFQRGDVESARSVFERGVRARCSDLGSLYHGYGMLEINCGNVERARSILQKGLVEIRKKTWYTDSTHRDRASFLSHTLGMLELNSNNPSAALEIFEEGLNRYGNSSQLLLGAALCEMRMGKDDSARGLFEMSVLNDRKHAQAWQAWAVMETRAGEFHTASTLFQCGIRSRPNHGALWHGYALLEGKRGNLEKSRILFSEGVKNSPQYVPLYQGWALLEMRDGNHQAARKLITEALTRNKKNGHGWRVAAEIEEADGNFGLVSLLLRRGIECAPGDAELYRALGDHLAGRGKFNDARAVYEKGMELNPTHAPLYHSLAELEARLFNVEGLALLNKRALQIFNRNALEPTSFSSTNSARVHSRRKPTLSRSIAVLAEKIVNDEENSETQITTPSSSSDPAATLDKVADNLIEGLLEDI
mmetsp:Transcript_42337/g.102314  ORF Transcript_42337/g.102314 Transcript_42337/m.102314 type:complete len:797 (+) Transcript_42337:374-2764(+)